MTRFKLVEITEDNLKVGSIFVNPKTGKEYEIIAVKDSETYGTEVVYYNKKCGFYCKELNEFTDYKGENYHCRLKIPIERIPFDLELFKTCNYDVMSRAGESMEVFLSLVKLNLGHAFPIIGINETGMRNEYTVHGKIEKLRFIGKDEDDLFLIEKE